MISKRIIKFALKLSVSLAFVVWLLFTVDWNGFWASTKQIDLVYIAIYLVLLLMGMVISAYKWKVLSEAKNFLYPLRKYFILYLSGTFVNNFMPSVIGGDTYRAYAIGKQEKRYAESAAAVITDRISGLLAAMILSIFFALLSYDKVISNKILLLLNGIILLCLLIFLFLIWSRHHAIWKKFLIFLPKNAVKLINEFELFYSDKKLFAKAMFVSILFSMIGLASLNYVFFAALGIRIDTLDYLSVIFLISIISSLPVSVNNIGIKEWAYITFFGLFGVNATVVATIAIISRFLQMGVSFLSLPFYLKNKN